MGSQHKHCRELDINDVNIPVPSSNTVEEWGIPGIYESQTHYFALLAFLKILAANLSTPAIRKLRCIAIPTAKVQSPSVYAIFHSLLNFL